MYLKIVFTLKFTPVIKAVSCPTIFGQLDVNISEPLLVKLNKMFEESCLKINKKNYCRSFLLVKIKNGILTSNTYLI